MTLALDSLNAPTPTVMDEVGFPSMVQAGGFKLKFPVRGEAQRSVLLHKRQVSLFALIANGIRDTEIIC